MADQMEVDDISAGEVIPDNDIYNPTGSVVLEIENFSDFAYDDSQRLISDDVYIRGLRWKILAIPTDIYLSFYLQCNADNADANWDCTASAQLRIIAQEEGKTDKVQKITHIFNAENNGWGYTEFVTFDELMEPENGWLDEERDTVVLIADVTAYAPHGVKSRASLTDRMVYLLVSGKGADVHFSVGAGEGKKEQFTAHKGILATTSYVFDRMFDIDTIRGNSGKVIEVTDVTAQAFWVMLNFIYTADFDGLNQENVFDVLHAAHKYNIVDLIDACADCPVLDVNNVLYVLGKALLYDVKVLIDRCWEFVDQNVCAVLKSDKLAKIDQSLLCDLFARDQLVLYEGEISADSGFIEQNESALHQNDQFEEIDQDALENDQLEEIDHDALENDQLEEIDHDALENDQFDEIDQDAIENDHLEEIDQDTFENDHSEDSYQESDPFARDQWDLQNGEIVIWNAAINWADAQCQKRNMEVNGANRREILGPALFNIRFPLIEKGDFSTIVVPSGILTKDEIISVLLYHTHPTQGVPDAFPLKFSTKCRAA